MLILFLFILIYFILFSYLSIFRLYSFGSHYYDLGIMHQVVYNTFKGDFLQFTNPHKIASSLQASEFNLQGLEEINNLRLAVHSDPILALLSPFYFIWSGPETLLVLQSFITALGAFFVFKIAKLVLKKQLLAILFASLYLSFYPLHFANLFDFHAVVFSPTLLLGGVCYLLKENFKLNFKALLFLFLATLTKENVIAVVFLIFLWAFWRSRKKIYLALAAGAFLYFVFVVKFVIPYFAGGSFFGGKYYTFSPSENLRRFFSKSSLDYLKNIFSPLFFLPLLSPTNLIFGFSEILKNTLSSNENMRNLYFHYSSALFPSLFISSIFAVSKMRSYNFKKILLFALVFYNLILTFQKGPFSYFFKKYRIDWERLEVVKQLSEKYSDYNLALSSTGQIAPFFAGRKIFVDFLFDPAFSQVGYSKDDIIKRAEKYKLADVVVIAAWEIQGELSNYYYKKLKQDKDYKLVYKNSGIEVYERKK